MSNVQVVHFKIEGAFLTERARDIFTSDSPKKAVNFLTESLVGLPEEMAVAIVLGLSKITGVNEVYVEDDDTTEFHNIPLSFENMWVRLCNSYLKKLSYIQMIKRRIMILGRTMDVSGALYRSDSGYYDAKYQRDFLFSDDKAKYYECKKEMDEVLSELMYVGSKINKTMLDVDMSNLEIHSDACRLPEDSKMMDMSFEELMDMDSTKLEKKFDDDDRQLRWNKVVNKDSGSDKMLDSYLKANREIDKKLSKKITPNPITDMNSAGWLAPNGDWYGLDGEIANMLHNTLADALVEACVVPESESESPDTWLSRNGWARVQKHNVQFEGYVQAKHGVAGKVKMTETQMRQLATYAKHFALHNDSQYLSLGLGGYAGKFTHKISAARFEMMDHVELEKMFDF